MYKLNIESLFHYTNSSGILGILKDNNICSIWMSKSDFLNDYTEVEYAKEIIETTLNELKNKKKIDEKLFDEIQFMMNTVIKFHCFIGSFSTKKDRLPMWDRYCKDSGYCIEFDFEKTILEFNNAFENKAYCANGKVIYKRDEQIKIIKNNITAIQKNGKKFSGKRFIQANIPYIENIANMLFLFKHETFEDEDEFRFICLIPNENKDKFTYKTEDWKNITKFRDSSGILVPFIEGELSNKILKGITLSPYNLDLRVYKGIELYLKKNIIKIPIEESNCKIR